jgi:lipopolysaccharide biosynthesis protein
MKKVEKEKKKNKKVLKNVKKALNYKRKGEEKGRFPTISKKMIHAIADSVNLNKAIVEKDNEKIKEWQHTYYQELFSEFRELVRKHNEIYNFMADELQAKIERKKNELKRLKAEIRKAEAEKALLAGND